MRDFNNIVAILVLLGGSWIAVMILAFLLGVI